MACLPMACAVFSIGMSCPRLGLRLVDTDRTEPPGSAGTPAAGPGGRTITLSCEGVKLSIPDAHTLVVTGSVLQLTTSSKAAAHAPAMLATEAAADVPLLAMPAPVDVQAWSKPSFDFRRDAAGSTTVQPPPQEPPMQIHQSAFVSSLLSSCVVRLCFGPVHAWPE
jgi:hypothetical protein